MDHEPDVRGIVQLRQDELLGPVVDRVGERQLEPADDFFARFARSVIRQQVSMAAATAIESRLLDRVSLTPEEILATDAATLREAGLSAQKAQTVHAIAERFSNDDWSRDAFAHMSNDRIIDELTTIRGVGVWTAKMQLIFSFARPDVFPVEDLGIRNGMEVVLGEPLSREEMVDISHRWSPVRSLASLYLWDVVD